MALMTREKHQWRDNPILENWQKCAKCEQGRRRANGQWYYLADSKTYCPEGTEPNIKVARIVVDGNWFYTDDLTHPKAQGAVIIVMRPDRYRSIPATAESKEFFNA